MCKLTFFPVTSCFFAGLSACHAKRMAKPTVECIHLQCILLLLLPGCLSAGLPLPSNQLPRRWLTWSGCTASQQPTNHSPGAWLWQALALRWSAVGWRLTTHGYNHGLVTQNTLQLPTGLENKLPVQTAGFQNANCKVLLAEFLNVWFGAAL